MSSHQKKDLLSKERATTASYYLLLALLSVSGLGLSGHVLPFESSQLLILIHVAAGIWFSYLGLYFLTIHFRHTLGHKRAGMIFSGLLLVLPLLALIVTGIIMLTIGKSAIPANPQIHWLATLALLLLIATHLVLHVFTFPEQRRKLINWGNSAIKWQKLFPTWQKKQWYWISVLNVLILLLVAILGFALTTSSASRDTDNTKPNYALPYGESLFLPSQNKTPNDTFVDAANISESERCATCHHDIAQQWVSSAHKQAASDPAYVRNIKLLVEKKGIAAARYCEGCHAPVALLTGQLTPGGLHGGVEGTSAFREGVSCLSCHTMVDAVHLDGVASYELAAAPSYLFENSNNKVAQAVSNLLIRILPREHKSSLNNKFIADPKSCATCHSQFMDESMNNWGWVKMQDEYAAWLRSPYSGQAQSSSSTKDRVTCQDCHMPLVESDDPAAGQDRLVRSHYFVGANTMLPALNGDQEHLQRTIEFMRQDRMRVAIQLPKRNDLQRSDFQVNASVIKPPERARFFYLNETVDIDIVVSNIGIGHDFPGGTTDINQAWLEVKVTDESGATVFHSGFVNGDHTVDTTARFYRSIPIDRRNQEVWKHDLFNMVGEAYRHVIASGENDLAKYSFNIPAWVQGRLTIASTLKYRKLNHRYAQWVLGGDYSPLPIVNLAQDTKVVDLRDKVPVKTNLPDGDR